MPYRHLGAGRIVCGNTWAATQRLIGRRLFRLPGDCSAARPLGRSRRTRRRPSSVFQVSAHA
eukprot:3201970-Prymnesium_polylepis.1